MSHRALMKIAVGCIVLVLLPVLLYNGLGAVETAVLGGQEPVSQVDSKTMVHDGEKYFPRQEISVFLILGIDREGIAEPAQRGGAADTLALMVFDHRARECSLLMLPCNTLVEITGRDGATVFDLLGNSHTYGTGMQDSCEITRTAVSQLLGGAVIDHYFAMNRDAIRILNETAEGTVSGMQWNREDIQTVLTILREKTERQENFALQSFEKMSDYVVTDCVFATLSSLLEKYVQYPVTGVYTLPGSTVQDVFHADEAGLKALVLTLFYTKI